MLMPSDYYELYSQHFVYLGKAAAAIGLSWETLRDVRVESFATWSGGVGARWPATLSRLVVRLGMPASKVRLPRRLTILDGP